MEQLLDPVFKSQIESGKVPGAAAVALDVSGKILFSKGYGYTKFGDTSSSKVTPQTPVMVWSCTKIVTSVAGLQLVEQGKINLNDPAAKYVPDIKGIKIVKGWNDDGSPQLVDGEKEILILHLFTHTSGMAYDFFDPNTLRWRIYKEQPPVAYISRSSIEEYNNPRISEAGARWNYGPNLEWLGFIVEKVSGLPLAEYIDKQIIQPLGLKSTGIGLTEEEDKDFFIVHARDANGKLTPTPMKMIQNPPVVPGGHYLFSTCEDYAQFLLALLNKGTHPQTGVKILDTETVNNYIFTDMLPTVGCGSEGVGNIPSTVAPVSCTGAFMPGVRKGWSLGAMINHEDLPNGRHKGSAAWAGLGNCYFWMDPMAGKLGFVVSGVMPFFDKDILYLADALERAVYERPLAKAIGEKGSNFEGGEFASHL